MMRCSSWCLEGSPLEGMYFCFKNMTTERDLRNQMTYAREEGREEGHVEERAKNAKNLRDLGVDPEIIAKATGLTVEEIRNL